MVDDLMAHLTLYLRGQIPLEAIREWIDVNVWAASEDARTAIDQVAVELAHVDDGLSGETEFRLRMADLVAPTISASIGEQQVLTQASSSNRDDAFSIRLELGGVTDLRVETAFV